MGAQWKQAGREANAQKRGQVVVKLVREIMVAAKLGGADPDLNARLAAAVEKARKASVTRDTIERAIKKGAGLGDEQIHYETVVYEGFAPAKVPVIVECLTENKNRTASDIRRLFKEGHLGAPGSVSWMFGFIEKVYVPLLPELRSKFVWTSAAAALKAASCAGGFSMRSSSQFTVARTLRACIDLLAAGKSWARSWSSSSA